MSVNANPPLPTFVTLPDVQFAVLPAGIHDATVSTIQSTFVNAFSANERRRQIFDGWITFRSLVRSLVQVDDEFIDGGFVTGKPTPKDVDVSLWISADNLMSMDATRQRILDDLIANARLNYKVDAYTVPHCPPGHPLEAVYQSMLWTEDYWSRCRDKRGLLHPESGPRKGYVRLIE
jgi:hypothetical protein